SHPDIAIRQQNASTDYQAARAFLAKDDGNPAKALHEARASGIANPRRSCFETASDTIAGSRRDGERTHAANSTPCQSRIALRQPGWEGRYPQFDAWPRRGGFAPHTDAASREVHPQTSAENSARSSRPGLRAP